MPLVTDVIIGRKIVNADTTFPPSPQLFENATVDVRNNDTGHLPTEVLNNQRYEPLAGNHRTGAIPSDSSPFVAYLLDQTGNSPRRNPISVNVPEKRSSKRPP